MESPQANAGIMRGGCPTLNTIHEQPVLIGSAKQHAGITEDGTSATLTSQEKEIPIAGGGDAMQSIVRRLTPLECTRLQGYYYCKPVPLETIFERNRLGIQIGFESEEEAASF